MGKHVISKRKSARKVILSLLPDDYGELTDRELEEKYGNAIIKAVQDAGYDVTKDDLEELLDLIDCGWSKPPTDKDIRDLM